MLTTIAANHWLLVLFGLAALGLAMLVGIIVDSVKFNVTISKGEH